MSKAKLAGLFHGDEDDDGELLTYAAPRVPQKPRSESTTAGNSEPVVLKACAVTTFRLVDGRYQPCGKLGIAVQCNPRKHDCRLILYAARDKQVAFAQMHVSFPFTITANNYASFYDSSNQCWSVLFDSETTLRDFAAHVCLGKFYCSDQSGILTLDITSGDGSPLQNGDQVEVRYSGRLVENSKIGREFDSNEKSDKLFRLKLGAKKVIAGWEEGLINMMKSGRRILVVPPNKGYGDKGMPGRVPPKATLVFDIVVVRVKHQRAHSDSIHSVVSDTTPVKESKRVDSPPLPMIPAMSPDEIESDDDFNVKQRTRSIEEKLSIGDSGSPVKNQNAKLIARMAKMGGHSVLPNTERPSSSQGHESSIEANSPVDHIDPISVHKVVNPKPQHSTDNHSYNSSPQQHMNSSQFSHSMYNDPQSQPSAFHPTIVPPSYQMQPSGPPGVYPPNPMQPGQLMPFQPQQAAAMMAMQQQMGFPFGTVQNPQTSQSATQESKKSDKNEDIHTAMLVSETRQQNTEIRVAISKLQDKVDNVWEKMSDLKASSGGLNYPNIEAGTLLQNLTRVFHENERLKQEVVDFSEKTEKQNEKISELLQKNQMFMESSNRVLELKNDDFKASATQSQQRVLDLEQDKLKLTKQLSELTGEVTQLQCLVNEYRKTERELKDKLVNVTSTSEIHKDEMALLRAQIDETTKNLLASQAAYKEETNSKREVIRQLESSEDEVKSLKQTLSSQEVENNSRITVLEENAKKSVTELEKNRKEYENEIDSLREKLREERAAGFSEKSLELNKMEEEMTEQWKTKCERMVRAERERLTRQIREVEEEKRRAETEVEQYEKRIETFRSKTIEMKQRFKDEIDSLKDELEESKSREREMDREELIKEVRRLMNQVFHTLRQKVMIDRRYRGERVLEMLRGTIKKMTLRLMDQEVSSSEEESESDDEAEINELKEKFQNEAMKMRQKLLEQQKQITALEQENTEQQRQLQVDQSLIADKEAALSDINAENVKLAASLKEMSASVDAKLTESSKNKGSEINDPPSDVFSSSIEKRPIHEESSSEEEEEEEETEESEEEEKPRQHAEVLSTKTDETTQLETDALENGVVLKEEDHSTSREEEESIVPKDNMVDVSELKEEKDETGNENDDIDVLESKEEEHDKSIEVSIESPSPVVKAVQDMSNPFSGGLTPPPLSSHDDDSSSDEQEKADPLASDVITDDVDTAEFRTPPSGENEKQDESDSPAKQIDSSEFDDILTRPQPSALVSVSIPQEDAIQTAKPVNDNVPLFGDDSDDDYDGIFGGSKTKEEENVEEGNGKVTQQVKDNGKLKKDEIDDKPKPPPLFDDDDDDDYDLFR